MGDRSEFESEVRMMGKASESKSEYPEGVVVEDMGGDTAVFRRRDLLGVAIEGGVSAGGYHGAVQVRGDGQFHGTAFFLSSAFDWRIVRDGHCLVLVPTLNVSP